MTIFLLYYNCSDNFPGDLQAVFDSFDKLKKYIYEDCKSYLQILLKYHPDKLANIKENKKIIDHILSCRDCEDINNLCLDRFDLGYNCFSAELNTYIE